MPIFENFYSALAILFIVVFIAQDPLVSGRKKLLIILGVALLLLWMDRPQWLMQYF